MKDHSVPGSARVLRVAIVEDHPVTVLGLERFLTREHGFEICGVADNAVDGLGLIAAEAPDVAIVDLTLRDSNGLELIESVRARGDRLPLLVFSVHEEAVWVERSLAAGANGYLAKDEPIGRVREVLRRLMAGEVYVSEGLQGQLLRRAAGGDPPDPVARLSRRERQIFRRIGSGRGTREIAEELHLSPSTVETHQRNIRKKLDLDSARELVHQAVRWVERGEP